MCGKNPTYDSGVILSVGPYCYNNNCVPPTPTPTQTPTNTPTQSITPTNTLTPTPTPTVTETPTPTVTETPTNTPTPSVTETPTNTPTNTLTPTPTSASLFEVQSCCDNTTYIMSLPSNYHPTFILGIGTVTVVVIATDGYCYNVIDYSTIPANKFWNGNVNQVYQNEEGSGIYGCVDCSNVAPCPTPTPTPTPTQTPPSQTPTPTATPPTLCPNCVSGDITIGTQVWSKCNLDVTTYRDNTPIPQVTDPTAWAALTTGAWCWYANNSANGPVYGKLYNWHAVNDTLHGGLAPVGYHVPTDAEWTVLTDYLGGLTVAGGKMKEVGFCHWLTPNTDATNTSLFTGLPGGVRNDYGTFNIIGRFGYWWSSTDISTDIAWNYNLLYDAGYTGRNGAYKKHGFSVRLIKD